MERGAGMGSKVAGGGAWRGKAEQRGVGVQHPKKDGRPGQSIIVYISIIAVLFL